MHAKVTAQSTKDFFFFLRGQSFKKSKYSANGCIWILHAKLVHLFSDCLALQLGDSLLQSALMRAKPRNDCAIAIPSASAHFMLRNGFLEPELQQAQCLLG